MLEHLPTGTRAQANERRSQAENRRVALRRLRIELALVIRTRQGSEPTELWQTRCRNGKIAVNPDHDDLPALLAEALDVVSTSNFDLVEASKTLVCTPSQLLKLIKLEPRALAFINDQRTSLGLRPMH